MLLNRIVRKVVLGYGAQLESEEKFNYTPQHFSAPISLDEPKTQLCDVVLKHRMAQKPCIEHLFLELSKQFDIGESQLKILLLLCQESWVLTLQPRWSLHSYYCTESL